MNQSEMIKRMTDQELTKSLVYTQFLLLFISLILGFILFDHLMDIFQYFSWNVSEIVCYGFLSGLLIVVIDLILMKYVPKKYFDDGGINERIFKNRSIGGILIIALCVAFTEELLFRGVIQSNFGLLIASLLFAFIHVRYLRQPLLLISVVMISFYFGYLFELTGNLLVTMTSHFIVDFLLGIIIRFKK